MNFNRIFLHSGTKLSWCLSILPQILRENRGIVSVRPYAKVLDELYRLEAMSADLLSDDNEPVRKKGKYLRQRLSGTDRLDPRESKWYKKYILDPSGNARDPTHQTGIEFRRRFRVPWSVFNDMCVEASQHPHFADHHPGKMNAIGEECHPIVR